MKLWIAIVVLTFATVGHAGKAEAGYYTAAELLKECESASVAQRNSCVGYLAGVVDITMVYDGWGYMNKEFCLMQGVSQGQLSKVVIKGLNERPEKLHLSASGLVLVIFRKAFPCD